MAIGYDKRVRSTRRERRAEQIIPPSPGALERGAGMSLGAGVLGDARVLRRVSEDIAVLFCGGFPGAGAERWLGSVGKASMSSVAGMG